MNAMTTVSAGPETGQERKAPGRPRNIQADEAFPGGVLALLGGGGRGAAGLSTGAVAGKAGVGRATIYRRWPNKEALLVDAVAAMKGPLPEPAGVSVRDDLVMLVAASRSKSARRNGKVTACLIPEFSKSEEMAAMYQAAI